MNVVCRRSVGLIDSEVKGRLFRGLAAVFDSPWDKSLTEQYGYEEIVKRGAFRKALARGDNVPLLLEHNQHQMLGTTQSGNVRISEDAKGLAVEAKLPDNYLGEYARSLIEAGDMRGMSYGIQLNKQTDHKLLRVAGQLPRLLVVGAQRMLDVSLTWSPAYNATTAELRSQGFVATPLQELLGGQETQTEPAAAEESPDEEPEAWWGDSPAEAEEPPPAEPTNVPYWERWAQQIEREC